MGGGQAVIGRAVAGSGAGAQKAVPGRERVTGLGVRPARGGVLVALRGAVAGWVRLVAVLGVSVNDK